MLVNDGAFCTENTKISLNLNIRKEKIQKGSEEKSSPYEYDKNTEVGALMKLKMAGFFVDCCCICILHHLHPSLSHLGLLGSVASLLVGGSYPVMGSYSH